MGVERDDDQGSEDMAAGVDKAAMLAERREVLDYVADIVRELAGLLDRHDMKGLGDDMRAIAVNALKAKYQNTDDPDTPEAPDLKD
jgi:hypothetical protein